MKIRAVATLEEAAKDLDAGKAFYDFNEEGIGLYFIDSLLSDIESLRIHRKKYGFYRMLFKRFPFALYYDIDGNIARVAAILDMRRDPKELQRRKG
jgi:hypothetical protein